MKVEVKSVEPSEAGADLLVVGLFEGGELPNAIAGSAGAGDAKGGFKKLTLLRPDGFPPLPPRRRGDWRRDRLLGRCPAEAIPLPWRRAS
jgi:hypothetical protein